MDAGADTRRGLSDRAAELKDSEPNFARFMSAAVNSADPEDFGQFTVEAFEAMLRKAYARLGKREGRTHIVTEFPAEAPGEADRLEIFSADMPFIVDSVLSAVRATGGTIRFFAHPVLYLDPESHRLLEGPRADAVSESLLIVHVEPMVEESRQALLAEIDRTLTDVANATRAWQAMLERLKGVGREWKAHPPIAVQNAIGEAEAFLGWLAEHNFTFLGMREYRLEGEGNDAKFVPLPETGLGLLEDPDFRFLRSGNGFVEMTPQHLTFILGPDPLMVTKANIRTRVHRRAYMDYIGIKLCGEAGKVTGELRIVGLFTSMALATANTEVPLVRRKVSEVMRRSGADPASHAGKALMAALETYPRDELFQISETLLFEFAREIAGLGDRPRVRVLPRIDRFDNFVSILVFVPRDRYSSDIRAEIGAYLAQVYEGHVSAYYPHFPEGELVRVHFIIGRDGSSTPRPAREVLEAAVTQLTLGFGDRMAAAAPADQNVAPWVGAFSTAYQARNSITDALSDVAVMESLADEASLALRLGTRGDGHGAFGLKVYHRGQPIPLSDRVPMLENFGFRVIDERTFTLTPKDQPQGFIHDMVLDVPGLSSDQFAGRVRRLEQAILAVWQTEAESDRLNTLTLSAGIHWADVAVLRAMIHYLGQVGVGWSRAYMIQTLTAHPEVALALVQLFRARLDLGFEGNRDTGVDEAHASLAAALEATASLDEDRIIRRLRNLVDAAVRTNAFQRDATGGRRPALAIKFECHKIDALPEPRPFREIFVYSPRVEGVHMRFGPVARGGLRWSDRPEDFRTEVLGLAKAQQVKNAIIVPVGAKGAFVPRLMPKGASRDVMMTEGTACYTIFVSTLLDVTDNLDDDLVVPPPDVRRVDGDDPYLVVAADKGTASFSDVANAIALSRRFWLGDAFASGGSHGYDHKKMGITARGAWESVKRHFREMDYDIESSPFSMVGVGDMSGDVFGNGLLLSQHARLIAAFDHQDIFVDPDPDPQRSLAERRRLFELPRSSWQDYDRDSLSPGGGVFSRSLKSVPLSDGARHVLRLGADDLTPQDVIRAILKSPVDLLWFGGIGTYLRGSDETDASVGDRANDPVRITGSEVQAKIVAEGANLAATQKGRVEFALRGGRIDTDAIDNSAGVNASDIEVNIKIALATPLRLGQLTPDGRDTFLEDMTDEVATLCLANNYLQTLALSLAERAGLAGLPEQRALVAHLEVRGLLQRSVEALPDDAAIDARATSGRGFTRPELATLLAYAKNALFTDLVASDGPDDTHLGHELFRYFPKSLTDRFPDAVSTHRLRREVIATVLANQMINRGGPGFAVKLMAATSADAGQLAAAFCLARDAFGVEQLYAEIDALDGLMSGAGQLALYTHVGALLETQTLWMLRNADFSQPLEELVLHYAEAVTDVQGLLGNLRPKSLEGPISSTAQELTAARAPEKLASRIADLRALGFATDIALVAARTEESVANAAGAYFGVLDLFGLAGIVDAASKIVLTDPFDRMALDRALANLMRAQRDLTADVLAASHGDVGMRLAAWRQTRPDAIDRAAASVADLTKGELTVSRLSVAAGLLSDLARSA